MDNFLDLKLFTGYFPVHLHFVPNIWRKINNSVSIEVNNIY